MSSPAVERLLARLERVKRNGAGWAARCPAHDDREPSLTVSVGDDARALVCCHAGCSAEAIVAAVGLELSDLFDSDGSSVPPPPPRVRRARGFDETEVAGYTAALLANETAIARLEELRGWTREAVERLGLGLDGERVVFPYRDGSGTLVGLGRYAPNRERRNGGPKLLAEAGSRRELFPPPESVDGGVGRVWLLEGEPDAVRATALGLAAVAVPGVKGWRRGWAARFAGQRVVVCFDSDAEGREAARRVAADLAGVAADVRPLDLDPAADDGYDLSDFTAAACSAAERAQARRLLEACAERAPSAPPEAASEPAGGRFRLEALTARELMTLPEPDGEAMLAGPYLRRGERTVVVGDTGAGKTTLALQFAAAALTGGHVLGERGAGCGPLLVVDLEQGLRTIKRTLREAGLADRGDVFYVRCPDGLALDQEPDHVAELERHVAEHRPAVLVLDPFYKAHRGDGNDERAVVDLMRSLDALRARHGFALLLPAHPRKDPASNPSRKLTLHDVAGSGAVTRGAEVVLAIERLAHGYARLRVLKDRDGELEVGEETPLLFTRGEGFRPDPKEERSAEELEAAVGADVGGWRTRKEWAGVLRVREGRARELLERMHAAQLVEYEKGPPGRHPSAECYRPLPGDPDPWEPPGAPGTTSPNPSGAPAAPAFIGNAEAGAPDGLRPQPGAPDVDEAEIERLADLARGLDAGEP